MFGEKGTTRWKDMHGRILSAFQLGSTSEKLQEMSESMGEGGEKPGVHHQNLARIQRRRYSIAVKLGREHTAKEKEVNQLDDEGGKGYMEDFLPSERSEVARVLATVTPTPC